jgi:monoamine oxidase
VTRLSLSDERYLVDGGTARIAQALAAPHASAIMLGKRLARVAFGGADVGLSFADGEEARFDRVILALPAPLLRTIAFEGALPTLWRHCFDEVRLGRCEKLIAGYDRTPWRKTIGTGGAIWSAEGFSEGWDAASATTGNEAPGALTYFMAGEQVAQADGLSPGELAKRFGAAARKLLPGLPETNGRLRRTRWCTDPLTRGAYMNFRPGQLTRFGELLTLEEEGRVRPSRAGPLLFAGEWLSDAWPGYMNGAVQTGRIAAEAAMATVGASASG